MYRTLSLRLQAAIQGGQSASTPDFDLRDWCGKAEAQVADPQKEIALLQEVNIIQAFTPEMDEKASGEKETTSTLDTVEPLSFPTLSGMDRGPTPRSSLHPGGGLGSLNTQCVSLVRGTAWDTLALMALPQMGPPGSPPFHSPWKEEQCSLPGSVPRVVQHDGQATTRNWWSIGYCGDRSGSPGGQGHNGCSEHLD